MRCLDFAFGRAILDGMKVLRFVAILLAFSLSTLAAESNRVELITLEPGHFHAGLVQKSTLPNVSPVVHVYSSGGQDLAEHLKLVDMYNKRTNNPTHWEEKIYTGPDYLEKMLREKAGNVVVLAGNNSNKIEFIYKSVEGGFNVLADKPMAIDPAGFEQLRKAFELAAQRKTILYDIMTERYEITTVLQRELSQMPDVFGQLEHGTVEDPAVTMVSVHHFYKEVSGKPVTRPAWFFDVAQQGEGIVDVTTHLVDLVQWSCFPEKALSWQQDVRVLSAKRWATSLTKEQFKKATTLDSFPEFLKKDVGSNGNLNVFANGEINYTLRGVHAKVSVTWNFEAPPGAKDTHYSMMRGTGANLIVKQGKEENYAATLYVENKTGAPDAEFEKKLSKGIATIDVKYPDVTFEKVGRTWKIVIPDRYNLGHEAHFAQVTEKFLNYLTQGGLPAWEVPNMIAKYYTTTQAYEMSRTATQKK